MAIIWEGHVKRSWEEMRAYLDERDALYQQSPERQATLRAWEERRAALQKRRKIAKQTFLDLPTDVQNALSEFVHI